jgi:hypothetical protein
MRLSIFPIKHQAQRYETVGDWVWDPTRQDLTIYVSKTGNWKSEMLVGIHEAVEALLCIDRGISQGDVDNFDVAFEDARDKDDGEPGDEPAAPYFKEHAVATEIEKKLCAELGMDWDAYDKEVSDASL